MFKGVIYERKNIINGKKYIGQTINLSNRNYDWNNKNDKLLNRFMSIREAAEKLNISHIQISRCCNNKLKTTMGYIFKFDK